MPGAPAAGAPRSMATSSTGALTALPEFGSPAVLLLRSVDRVPVALLLDRFELQLTLVAHGEEIPGSFWGEIGRAHV